MSVAYPNLPVTFVGFVPGITTPGGVTHQSINDVGIMRTVPNMAIFDVGDATLAGKKKILLEYDRDVGYDSYLTELAKKRQKD